MKHSQPKVHVIGAGVTGLTTALLLRMKGYDVTILAKDFPGDDNSESTVSCMAAGWKSVASSSETRLQRMFKMHFQAFLSYIPILVNPQRYLQWLQSQYLTLGGKRKRLTLTHILEATMDDENNVDVIVNCTGVHARWLGGVLDKNIVPVRVQDTVVRASHIRKAVFIKWVDLNKAKETMERITALCPELTNGKSINELDVVAHVVGMNGRRQGGPRVDNEFISKITGESH
ncbi:hypothetical protein DFQ28_003094 [Apophysomyces sp. BC1034]|nr:hypothetical protein DFQ28_003094 [Apophysomyces sp. BC1034]